MATLIKTAALASTSKAFVCSGKGSQARTTAFLQVAPLAFQEDVSRAASLNNMRVVLGKSPTDAQSKAARTEWIIGRVASRLPVADLPKGQTSPVARLEFARKLVTQYAQPATGKGKTKKLRAGKIGWRTVTQHRVVRSAEDAASLFWADLGLSGARTLAEKNSRQAKATRAPSMAGSGKGKAATPSHAELVKSAPAVTSDDYVQHMQTQLAALVAFDAKNAKKRPTTHGAFAEALLALRQLGNKAANDYEERKAKANAAAK